MKTGVIGAGAMGSVIGGLLAGGGKEVTLVDVWKPTIDAINANGLKVEDKAGAVETAKVRATDEPAAAGLMELVLVFVKCYHTETAVRNGRGQIGPNPIGLARQNGGG